jgi:hypothetical protein
VRPCLTDGWQVSLTTWSEAGEQMKNLAADVQNFLDLGLAARSRPFPTTGG